MPSVHDYKYFEAGAWRKAGKALAAIGRVILGALKSIGAFLIRRYTVVFVPHSEKRVYNFHVNVLSIFCFFLVIGGMIGGFFMYSAANHERREVAISASSRLNNVQASLDQMKDEANNLLMAARNFEPALSGLLSTIGRDAGGVAQGHGDLDAFFDIRETPEGMPREADDMRRLATYFASVTNPLIEIGGVLGSQAEILSDIPSIWPVSGGLGRVTMPFGHNRHPFTGQFYLHNGIDISTGRAGDAVVAAANGQVVTVSNDPTGYGNYVIIRHRHGYYTRYAHLLSTRVRLGQRVEQGDTIGNIGSTGMSTGPHLHFEVMVGSDVVDPLQYMKIRTAYWTARR